MSPAIAFFVACCLFAASASVQAASLRQLQSPRFSFCGNELCNATTARDESKIREAIENGVEKLCTCECDKRHNPLLHIAAVNEAVAIANLLLDDPPNCDVDFRDLDNNTALHDAAEACATPMAYVLLSGGADVEALNNDGDTPLCVAAKQDDPNCAGIVNHLVEFGAGIDTECNDQTPLELAVNQIVKDIIIQRIADAE